MERERRASCLSKKQQLTLTQGKPRRKVRGQVREKAQTRKRVSVAVEIDSRNRQKTVESDVVDIESDVKFPSRGRGERGAGIKLSTGKVAALNNCAKKYFANREKKSLSTPR